MNSTERRGLSERFERQAVYCADMGAPFCAALLRAAASDYDSGGPTAAFFGLHPGLNEAPALALRFLAALHACALGGTAPQLAAHFPSCGGDGDAAAAFAAACALLQRDDGNVAALCRRTPQTNEPARAMPLLAGLLRVAAETALPIRLFEFGASAGINTRLDAYRYEGRGWSWGNPRSPLVLRNREREGVPQALAASLRIVERSASDVTPLDLDDDDDRCTLRSFIWADQCERLERFDRACRAARSVPLRVERAAAPDWVRDRVCLRAGAATVLMHSVVYLYLSPAERSAVESGIRTVAATATAAAPFAWLRMEPELFETRLTFWPGEREVLVARSDGHGQDIVWSAS